MEGITAWQVGMGHGSVPGAGARQHRRAPAGAWQCPSGSTAMPRGHGSVAPRASTTAAPCGVGQQKLAEAGNRKHTGAVRSLVWAILAVSPSQGNGALRMPRRPAAARAPGPASAARKPCAATPPPRWGAATAGSGSPGPPRCGKWEVRGRVWRPTEGRKDERGAGGSGGDERTDQSEQVRNRRRTADLPVAYPLRCEQEVNAARATPYGYAASN